jgi:hypothetical protein
MPLRAMADTPAAPVPESSPGVPATTPALAAEPALASEPLSASQPPAPVEPPVAIDLNAPVEPVTAPQPTVAATPEPPEGMTFAAAATSPGPVPGETAVPPAPTPDLPPTPAVSPTPDLQPALAAPPAAAAVEALAAMDPGEPRVAATLDVPPLPAAAAGSPLGAEGGEWDLLVGKVKVWLEQADLPGQWDRLSGPLRGLGLLLGLLLVLKLYGALLDTLDDLLLLPRLLQLVGLIVLVRFSLRRLTRSSDRQLVLDDWKRRWDAFRGS